VFLVGVFPFWIAWHECSDHIIRETWYGSVSSMEDPIGISDAKPKLPTEEDKTSQSLQNSSE